MGRVTKKDLYAQIEWLNKQFNVEDGAVGSYQLDCAYGGYRLVKLANSGGGQSDVQYYRGTARETMNFIRAYSAGAEAVQREVDYKGY
jgi:hypothetical protein